MSASTCLPHVTHLGRIGGDRQCGRRRARWVKSAPLLPLSPVLLTAAVVPFLLTVLLVRSTTGIIVVVFELEQDTHGAWLAASLERARLLQEVSQGQNIAVRT